MAQTIEKIYGDAIASGLFPGVSLIAGDRDGNILYSKSFGKASLKEGTNRPFTDSTVASIASMTKLMTSIAVLQCVEDGTLNLDADIKPLLPEIGKYGIITGFDDAKNSAIFAENTTPITLRMLLSHTSGHEYDRSNPLLTKWRLSRGKTVEAATKSTLDEFMRRRIWTPLGIENEASFFPKTRENLKDRLADMSMLKENKPPAAHISDFDILGGAKDCFGGAGVYTSAKAYYAFLSAVLRRDPKLLTPASYEELFRPQLDERCEQGLNDQIYSHPLKTQYLGMQIPASVRKTWSFAGLVAKEGQEGRFAPGTTLWGGYPSCEWFIDHEAGICGVAVCQILPPMQPDVMALHEKFQKAVFSKAKAKI
ncbi:beta-lactamase/transpeptidase-like protein [Hypoxylon sp. FL1857]|nr:beta-lactamase/transpeptidase-like protein [Hypoxylon sp. FL1857]